MDIRLANETDLLELSALFRQTVLVHAPKYYTKAQTEVWAASPLDVEHFRQFILEVTTFVAIDKTGILGFSGIGDNGHVASAYVRYNSLHQGIGSKLMKTVLNYAHEHHMQRLYAEASEFSLGLFKKFGFQLYDTEVVSRQGVEFERYLVELFLLELKMDHR
ncbi:acetyltransferase, N-acetylglutamate synthase [Leptolyngbya sp. PCC 7375]|nr:acetyltransferase, N-acetylglutamate synthase [Leptolyngbya sp. PCC 7375]